MLNGRSLGEKKVADPLDPVLRIVDRPALKAGVADLASIEIRVLDHEGRTAAVSDSVVEVQVTGAGVLAAIDLSDGADLSPVQAGKRKTYQGRVLALARAGKAVGEIQVQASAGGLKPAAATLAVR